MSRRLAAAGLTQVALAASTGWPLAAVTARPELLEKAGVTAPRRIYQCHVDLLMMGGLVTAAGAACDPPAWAATAVTVGGWTNPLLFLPLAKDPKIAATRAYALASVVSFAVTTAGWFGVARAAWQLRHQVAG